MKELDKTKIYDLSEFTSNEKNQLLIKLIEIDVSWDKELPKEEFFSSDFLYFSTDYVSKGEWLVSDEIQYTDKEIVNAKELFYNLENVQVDCRYLTNEQIDEIADVFKKYGYRIGSLSLMEEYCFIRQNAGKYCLVTTKHKNKTTITYEKFMELFGYKEKSEEFKNLVEVLNEELTEEAERQITLKDLEKTQVNSDVDFYTINKQKPKQYQAHYNNENGSLYKIATDLGLNHWEFDIFKRLVRCRKKNQFKEDLQKIKDTIDIYLNEYS